MKPVKNTSKFYFNNVGDAIYLARIGREGRIDVFRPCESAQECSKIYKNYYVCGGRRKLVAGALECGFHAYKFDGVSLLTSQRDMIPLS